ncbi:MAG: hypothetical protein QNI86_13205 [Halieaceae bacterium]|nr:hypothetical protein [Halieaceae bacterium]
MSKSSVFGFVANAAVLSLMAISTACATNQETNPKKAPAKADFSANTQFEIKSGRGVIVDPTVLVVFKRVGPVLCPVDTQFKVGNTPLATGVPTLTKSKNDGPPRNTMTWKAVDSNLDPLTGLTDWHYALVFHPFARAGAGSFISQPVNEPGVGVVQQIGPFDLRWEEQIPVGVDYKYSIVRVVDVDPDPNRREWEILRGADGCKPLDPNIRVW